MVSFARIRTLLADARRHGYAFWPALISEAYVVAVPILDRDGGRLARSPARRSRSGSPEAPAAGGRAAAGRG